MSLLLIKIYLTKYYDLFFLLAVILFIAVIFFLKRYGFEKKISYFTKKIIIFLEKSKGKTLLFLAVFLVAIIVRLYSIQSPIADWHSFRQADTASVTRVFVEEGYNPFYPRYYDISTTQSGLFNPNGYRFVEFPIYNTFHFIAYKFFPLFSLEILGRLVTIITSMVSAYFIYLLGKRQISYWGGIIAMIYFLFIPYNIFFSRVILPDPMAVTFALASLWFFQKYIDLAKNVNLLSSAVLLSFALLIKPYTLFYLLPMIYLAIQKFGYKGIINNKKLIISSVLCIIPLLLWRIWMRQYPEGIPFWKWTFNGDGIRYKPAFWYWLISERLGKLILGIGGIIPFSLGILAFWKKNKLFHVFLFGSFAYVSIIATANVRHDYYQILIIPAIVFELTLGTIYLWKTQHFNLSVSRSVLLISLLLLVLLGVFQVKEYYKINHPEIIVAGKAVQRLTPKESLVIASYFGDTAFLYQTERFGWPVVDRPINEMIDNGAEYFASVNLNDPQTKEFMQKFKVLERTNQYVVIKLN